MIFLHAALPIEGMTFIRYFEMKQVLDFGGAKFFSSSDNTKILAVSGIGDFKAASCVSAMLSKFSQSSKDIFINFGICGSRDRTLSIGEIVRCVKSSRNDEKNIFPDIIYETKNKYKFVHVETVVGAAKPKENSNNSNIVVDNEAYGALYAANLFLPSENCFSFKVISDYSDDTYKEGIKKFDQDFVKKILEDASLKIIDECLNLESQAEYKNSAVCKKFSEEEYTKIKKLECDFEVTFAVKEIFENLMWRDKLLGIDIEKRIEGFAENFAVMEKLQEKRDTFNEILEELKK